MVTIVNIKLIKNIDEFDDEDIVAYCGNNKDYWATRFPIINMMLDYSVLGKPRSLIVRGDRQATINNYKEYLQLALSDISINRSLPITKGIQDLKTLKPTHLACWCAPLDCHCEVIREYLQ